MLEIRRGHVCVPVRVASEGREVQIRMGRIAGVSEQAKQVEK